MGWAEMVNCIPDHLALEVFFALRSLSIHSKYFLVDPRKSFLVDPRKSITGASFPCGDKFSNALLQSESNISHCSWTSLVARSVSSSD